MKLFTTTLICIGLYVTSFAQQKEDLTSYTITNQQVEPASRILEFPKIIDSVKASPVKDYPLLFFQAETKILLDTIEAATVETTEKLDKLYPFYVKAGIGSVIMPLGEIRFGSDQSRNLHYGANITHLSSYGDIKDRNKVLYAPAQYDRSAAHLYGRYNERNYQIKADAFYHNNGFHYYGVPLDSLSAGAIQQGSTYLFKELIKTS